MATFNFKELFSNQFRKDGTLKARNTIENYMHCLHNRYTNIYKFIISFQQNIKRGHYVKTYIQIS